MVDSSFDSRIPPRDEEAEQAVLGAMLLDKHAISAAQEVISASDYYFPRHATIHEVIMGLSDQGQPADAITVAAALRDQGNLERVGGAGYLHELTGAVITTSNVDYYAKSVRDCALKRRIIDVGQHLVQLGYSQMGEAESLIDDAEAEVMAIAKDRQSLDYAAFGEFSQEVLNEIESIQHRGSLSGVPTGFHDLDDLTQGLHPGQMVIVAARPAMGKSTLALDFCRSASLKHNQISLIFSLEMSRAEIAMRLLSAETHVPLSRIRRANGLTQDDWAKIVREMGTMSDKPLYIDDSPNVTMREIRAKSRRIKQHRGLDLIVVDYLQLMSSGRSFESRQQEVSEYSRSLKLLAKELEVPVVAVAQLNRGPEQRTDKRPMMADLRESGSLEQDADVVMLLHRPDYYDENDRPGEADIIVAKHRNGETRTIPVTFLGQFTHFADMARVQPEPF